MAADAKPHVVIVGAGFAGLNAAQALKRAPVRITVVDRTNHHLFQPLLYQVATAGLNPSDIAVPIRRVLRKQKNAEVVLAEVKGVDLAQKQLVLESGTLAFDYLIVATGATHSYFGNDQWASVAPGLKSLEDALDIRRRMLLAYERAERTDDPVERAAQMTFIVVGGGATGVELAGSFAEIARHTLAGDFRRIDPRQAKVLLIEGLGRVLSSYPEDLSEKARLQLEGLGVQVWLNTRVTGIDERGVTTSGGRIEARTVLWAAGVAASPLAKSLGVPLDRQGRVKVEPDLSVPGAPNVFVCGDLASTMQANGKPVPGVAPAAIQMGRHAAKCVERLVRGEKAEPFAYWDKGSLATIGRNAAVAEIGKLHFGGFPAWLAWLLIHVFFLISFRNRVFVLAEWAWSYLTWERGARLITGANGQTHAPDQKHLPPLAPVDDAAREAKRAVEAR